MIIKESLIKLLQTKDIHKITVTDICKEADINRGTFYTHYNDPLDLLQNIEDELFNKILEYLSEDTNPESLLTVLTKVFELAKDNKELCKILLFKEGDNRILNRILYIANNDNIIKFQSNSKNVKRLDRLTVHDFLDRLRLMTMQNTRSSHQQNTKPEVLP